MKGYQKNKGFTLLELLVVIAIIGILSSVVMVSLSKAKAKARDAKRMQDLKEMQTAVNLYYHQNGTYPGTGTSRTGSAPDGCGVVGSWCGLETELRSFIPQLPRDPLGNQSTYQFSYKHNSQFNPNDYYAISFRPENPSSFTLDQDGLVSVGDLPAYCKGQYSFPNSQWNVWDGTKLCLGGN